MTGNSPPRSHNGAMVEDHHRTKGLLRLTMACNERCSFCNVPAEDYPHSTPPSEELDAELETFVATGQRTLTISGGEPTLYRQRLVQLVRNARQKGLRFVELQTNAVLIDAGYAAELAAAGLTSTFVPLLSHRSELHDDLMGREGAFDDALHGIDALQDAGVLVTLNVVLTRPTEQLVAELVDFVAQRLVGVQSISLSAVQPHGRAARQLDLLPDYARLAPAVRAAQRRAKEHGIELLNPYCGLPLCVGWEDDVERCVEAIESAASQGGGFGEVPGLDNRGDKRHGEPCGGCAWRTRCGGAWHAYWDHRRGSGIHPPERRIEPCAPGATSAPGQSVVDSGAALTDAALERLTAATTPTVWLVVTGLAQGDGARVAAAGCTDLDLRTDSAALVASVDTARELRQVARRNEPLPPQGRLRTMIELRSSGTFSECYAAVRLGAAAGVEAVRLHSDPDHEERWQRFLRGVRNELPELDISLIEAP